MYALELEMFSWTACSEDVRPGSLFPSSACKRAPWASSFTNTSLLLQQELSAHADEEAERFRAFLLRRLLPATQAFYSEHPVAGGDPDEAAALAHRMMARLAERTTAELEGRLAEFFARLVQARRA